MREGKVKSLQSVCLSGVDRRLNFLLNCLSGGEMTVAPYPSPERYAEECSYKILHKEVVVPATLDQVWQAWTTTEGTRTFFSSSTRVELRLGGAYEVYFLLDQPYGSQGSEECKILSFLPKKMLSFEWNAPPHFGELRNKHTQVILRFDQITPELVKVTFDQLGWGKGEEWDKLYQYFDKAWDQVLNNLKKRFVAGPLDWTRASMSISICHKKKGRVEHA